MPLNTTSLTPTVALSSIYQVDLILTIPHDSSFYVRIYYGNDTRLVSGSIGCSSLCSNISSIGLNTIELSILNPFPNSTSYNSIIFNLTNFINPRNIGSSLPWIVSTYTTDGYLISNQSSIP